MADFRHFVHIFRTFSEEQMVPRRGTEPPRSCSGGIGHLHFDPVDGADADLETLGGGVDAEP